MTSSDFPLKQKKSVVTMLAETLTGSYIIILLQSHFSSSSDYTYNGFRITLK